MMRVRETVKQIKAISAGTNIPILIVVVAPFWMSPEYRGSSVYSDFYQRNRGHWGVHKRGHQNEVEPRNNGAHHQTSKLISDWSASGSSNRTCSSPPDCSHINSSIRSEYLRQQFEWLDQLDAQTEIDGDSVLVHYLFESDKAIDSVDDLLLDRGKEEVDEMTYICLETDSLICTTNEEQFDVGGEENSSAPRSSGGGRKWFSNGPWVEDGLRSMTMRRMRKRMLTLYSCGHSPDGEEELQLVDDPCGRDGPTIESMIRTNLDANALENYMNRSSG
eukprot:Selendium_serpulae@DN6046_c0_g1_i10.p1